MRYLATIALLLLVSVSVTFAGNVRGLIKDADSKEPLIGANVVLLGTTLGSTTDEDGFFLIQGVSRGDYKLEVSYLGYQQYQETITVGAGDVSLDIDLTAVSLVGSAINIVSSRARERETPVAFTDVSKQQLENELGSRDIPLVLNTTPSVYATGEGGGAGDARVNVRGFDQRNFAIMINGVPVNDMENGWVYWSNWDGVGDATSSIQMQRGLSAVNLATPSIGGTMNVRTDPTAQNSGGKFKQEFGYDGFLKTTLLLNTGMIDDKYAFSGAIVRKLGDGLMQGTWTDAWAYYFGASYNINKNNRLELYALGAPQRHGQNLFAQNIGVYSREYARSLDGYDVAAFDVFDERGRRFNQNYGPVDPSYAGKQSNGPDDIFDRHEQGFINERENFYHKPQVNLNWFTNLSEQFSLYSILYYSGGQGGGTGTYGSVSRDANNPSIRDWDATIARNRANATGSVGLLRNSRNNQWTIGAISKATYKFNSNLQTTFGIDWRTAEIEHYREVRDLLGGEYFDPSTRGLPVSDFWSAEDMQRGLGDRIDYDFTNTVDWLGAFAQGEYNAGALSAYGMAGWSTIKYNYTNNFFANDEGDKIKAESDQIGGYQIKGGLGYKLSPQLHAYGNVGYVSKVPIFDNVISDRDGTKAADPQNEKFQSYEGGLNFRAMEGRMNLKANVYYTSWKDRSNSIGITNPDGSEGIVFITGMNATHQGFEFEAAYQPIGLFRIDAAASLGNWKLTDDVRGFYKDYSAGQVQNDTVSYYVKDLKVGDAPQTQLAVSGTLMPIKGLRIQGTLRHYRDHYAEWDPFSRTSSDDRTQSWKAPDYSVVDLHASYDLPLNLSSVRPQLFVHVFNALDETYIQDALDNSQFNSFDQDHDADDAEIFLGLPRYINFGVTFNF